jgi:hypothetical protein
MQTIGKRYINAINQYVSAMGKLSGSEREKLTMTDSPRPPRQDRDRGDRNERHDRGGDRNHNRERNFDRDNRNDNYSPRHNAGGGDNRKIQTLENDIATYRNNLEFFAKSKNADKLRQDVEAKIQAAEKELKALKDAAKGV